MIDHIAVQVADFESSKEFYGAILPVLGYELLMDHPISGAGYGSNMKTSFFFLSGVPTGPMHIAFASLTRAAVDAFYEAALAAGATGNGMPGVRDEYHPTYYGAFVIDPDGNNVEAVCHLPE